MCETYPDRWQRTGRTRVVTRGFFALRSVTQIEEGRCYRFGTPNSCRVYESRWRDAQPHEVVDLNQSGNDEQAKRDRR